MLSSGLRWLLELSPASPLAAPRSGLERSDFVRLYPKSAFSRFAPVPRPDLEGQEGVELARSELPPHRGASRASGLVLGTVSADGEPSRLSESLLHAAQLIRRNFMRKWSEARISAWMSR
jgi:hypothetical protein